MADLAIELRCRDCRTILLRDEVEPGDEIEIPDHECGA